MSRTQYFTTAFFLIALQQLVFSAYADSEHSSPTHHTHKAIEITWKEVNELGCTFIDYINTTPIVPPRILVRIEKRPSESGLLRKQAEWAVMPLCLATTMCVPTDAP